MRRALNIAFAALVPTAVAVACRLDDPTPDPPAAAALEIFPASHEVHGAAGGTVTFAVQAKAASGEAVDGIEVFLAADENEPLTFEAPSSSAKTARGTTKRDSVASLSVDGVVPVRIAIGSGAAPGAYPVFCALSSLATDDKDPGASPRPVMRVNVIVDKPDAAADAAADASIDGGADAG